jgi:hypothetical protein
MRLQMLTDQQANGSQYQSSANMASRGRGGNRGRGANRGRGGRGRGFGGRGINPTEQIQEDKAPPNQGVRSVTNLTILLLSVGIGLKKNFSPTATRVQGSWRQDMALIQIGMLTVEPLIISLASLTSSP